MEMPVTRNWRPNIVWAQFFTRWFKKKKVERRPLFPNFSDRRFWTVQAIVVAVAAIHDFIEISGNLPHLGPLYFLPISIFFVPVVYAALNFGLRGSITTVVWIIIVTIPNWVLWHHGLERVGVIFQMLVFVAVAYFVGLRVDREAAARRKAEDAEAALKNYVTHVVNVQEKERQRIARELHDQTIQMMVYLCRQLDTVAGKETLPVPASERLHSAREISDQIMQSLRNFAKDLRPPALDDLGISYSISKLLLDFGDRTGIKSHLKISGEERRLPADIEIGLYRIAQEVLRNVEHHSGAKEAVISLSFGVKETQMTITDDGMGFNVPSALENLSKSDHFGLVGMQERAELLGGSFKIQSHPDEGTVVSVFFPTP